MRLHLPALPGQPLTRENSHCAYTQKVRKFANMMSDLGHEIIVYGGNHVEANCAELVNVYASLPDDPPPADHNHPVWIESNAIIAHEIGRRVSGEDLFCSIFGNCQKGIADKLDIPTVEFGIGYGGTFAEWRVFESYAWLHAVTAAQAGDANTDGSHKDTVIPNYFELHDFPYGAGHGDYILYLGRMIDRKGVEVAEQAAEIYGELPIVFAGGHGDWRPTSGTYLGPVGPAARADLLKDARVLLAPTRYLEPFGGVAVEAQLCGTPVIASPWGAFPETVEPGKTGYLAGEAREIADLIPYAMSLDRSVIRDRAILKYTCDFVAPKYDKYLEKVLEWSE